MSNLLSVSELRSLLARGPVKLVEVLPAEHFARGHIPGAVNLPLAAFESLPQGLTADREQPLVLYCANENCSNSHIAAKRLEAFGYSNVHVFAGGKADWVNAGFELEVTR
jgi:rhodanese-related sulfurtransferase